MSTPSHQTGRNLSRLQFKNWTREHFHCDFWKLSLQHSPLSPAAPKAQTGPHVHITNTSSLTPPPLLTRAHSWLLAGSTGNCTGRTGVALGQGSAELPALGQPLMGPQCSHSFGARGRRNVTAIPVLEHKPGIIISPVPVLTKPQLSFLCTFARRLSWKTEKEELGQLLIFFEC